MIDGEDIPPRFVRLIEFGVEALDKLGPPRRGLAGLVLVAREGPDGAPALVQFARRTELAAAQLEAGNLEHARTLERPPPVGIWCVAVVEGEALIRPIEFHHFASGGDA